MNSAPRVPVTFRPRVLLIGAIAFTVILLAGMALGWFGLPTHIRERFTAFQIITLIIIAGVLIGFMMALGLSKVTADAEGLQIRNAISFRRLRWAEISEITYRHNDPWAFATLAGTEDDPVRRQLMAIQTADGPEKAYAAVTRLREVFHYYRDRQAG